MSNGLSDLMRQPSEQKKEIDMIVDAHAQGMRDAFGWAVESMLATLAIRIVGVVI